MRATMAIVCALPVLMLAMPASAITKEERMATCKFGADNDKLAGKKRDAFIKRCMANANYEPAARRDALKKPAADKKMPVMAPASAPAEAPAEK